MRLALAPLTRSGLTPRARAPVRTARDFRRASVTWPRCHCRRHCCRAAAAELLLPACHCLTPDTARSLARAACCVLCPPLAPRALHGSDRAAGRCSLYWCVSGRDGTAPRLAPQAATVWWSSAGPARGLLPLPVLCWLCLVFAVGRRLPSPPVTVQCSRYVSRLIIYLTLGQRHVYKKAKGTVETETVGQNLAGAAH